MTSSIANINGKTQRWGSLHRAPRYGAWSTITDSGYDEIRSKAPGKTKVIWGKSRVNYSYNSPYAIWTFAPIVTTVSFSHLYKYIHGGSQIFKNFKSHLKISCARGVTWTNFHAEGPQILGVIVPATWRPRILLPWTSINVRNLYMVGQVYWNQISNAVTKQPHCVIQLLFCFMFCVTCTFYLTFSQ
jgi:hypothetical protein